MPAATETSHNSSHPVLSELARRRDGETTKLRLALCIEGGGMRSVISAGMANALLENEILPEYFDTVFGTSGGAFNAAYYLANQSAECVSGYYENTGKELVDFGRLLLGKRPPIDVEHMMSGIQYIKPLDFNTVLKSQKLRPIAIEMDSRKAKAFTPAQTKEELLWQLRATSAVPVLGSGRVKLNGQEYLDGGMLENAPFDTPLSLGYDALLILATKRPSFEPPSYRELRSYNRIKQTFGRIFPDFMAFAAEDPILKYNTEKRMYKATTKLDKPPFVYVIYPSKNDTNIGRFSLEPEVVKIGARIGRSAVNHVVGQL